MVVSVRRLCDFILISLSILRYYLKLLGNFIWFMNYPFLLIIHKIFYMLLIMYDVFKTLIFFQRFIIDYCIGLKRRKRFLLLFNPINLIFTTHVIIITLENGFFMWFMIMILIAYYTIIFFNSDRIWVSILGHYIESDFSLLKYTHDRKKLYFKFLNECVRTSIF